MKRGNTQYIGKLKVMVLVHCTFPCVVMYACEVMSVAVILWRTFLNKLLKDGKTMLKQYPICLYVLGTFPTFKVWTGNL